MVNGAGAAGVAISHMLLEAGVGELTVCDRAGILTEGSAGMTDAQAELARLTAGAQITPAALESAGELLDAAQRYKKESR